VIIAKQYDGARRARSRPDSGREKAAIKKAKQKKAAGPENPARKPSIPASRGRKDTSKNPSIQESGEEEGGAA